METLFGAKSGVRIVAGILAATAGQAAVPGSFNVQDFRAKADATTDCTAAFQKAIDAAAIKGGVVEVPVGRWLCKGHLELKMGVHLSGANQAPQSWEPAAGSILLPTEGRGTEDAPAFIEMRTSTSIKGVTVYHPEQKAEAIQPYPWTIQIRAHPGDPKSVSFDSTVENVTLINSYNGIRTGPTENGRHRLFQMRAWWFDPRDGTATDLGILEKQSAMDFHAPGSGRQQDWVLVLDDAASGYLPPGMAGPKPLANGAKEEKDAS